MALGLNDFFCGQIHYSGHWKGRAMKSRLLGPDMAMSEARAIWALVMDVARIKIITSRAIKTTGTLLVNIPLLSINRSCASKSDILVSFCAL
jgi:hypothetical protein